jgi:hypothetical protein
MPKRNCPMSYDQAIRQLDAASDRNRKTISFGIVLRRADDGRAVSVMFDGEERVTFFPDGRIRIRTGGRNAYMTVQRINACLPPPYRVRRMLDGSLDLELKRGERTVARFLSSTTFTPEALCASSPEAA